ncbi:MAG TPA: hypothetical protein VIF62_06410 [Labilithrix sp.]|jgi:hypothetical protein
MKRFLFALALVACSSSSSSTSTSPPPAAEAGADTWTNFAQGFTSTYCVECHGASDTKGRDYTQYAKVAAEKAEIRCGVAASQDPSWSCASFPPAKQFPIDDGKSPPNAKPSDADRARMVAWLTAGAPE